MASGYLGKKFIFRGNISGRATRASQPYFGYIPLFITDDIRKSSHEDLISQLMNSKDCYMLTFD